jgi:hypothetical protein
MIPLNIKHPYISQDASIQFFDEPYRHFVIKNLLREDIYASMCARFPEYIGRRRGRPHGAVGDTGRFYKASIYSMRNEDCVDGYDFFVWEGWKDFVAGIFSLVLNNHTAYSLHHHTGSPESPSDSGWSHLDLNICSVIPSQNPVEITKNCKYAEDTRGEQPHTEKVLRSVALLYYFNNPDGLTEQDGGGTGIYADYNSSSLIKTILPHNNSLFAFEVGTDSYHGFIGARFDRSAIVQWFHSSPAYIVSRNLPKFKARWRQRGYLFERWGGQDPWELEMDPEYNKYFSAPLSEVLK